MIRRDWRFSEEGDLELGSPRFNENGELIYVDIYGNISTDPAEGIPVQDIARHSERNVIKQVLRNRLLTDAPDWYHHPDMGGNLSDLTGEPNTRETANRGVALITNAIAYDNYINPSELSVRAVPISATSILFYIELEDITGTEVEYPLLLDLEHGLLTEYELPKPVVEPVTEEPEEVPEEEDTIREE